MNGPIKIKTRPNLSKFQELKKRFCTHLNTLHQDISKRMKEYDAEILRESINKIANKVGEAMQTHKIPQFKYSVPYSMTVNMSTNELELTVKYHSKKDDPYIQFAIEWTVSDLKKKYEHQHEDCLIVIRRHQQALQYYTEKINMYKFGGDKAADEIEASVQEFYKLLSEAKGVMEKYTIDLQNCSFLKSSEAKRLFRADIPKIKFIESKY